LEVIDRIVGVFGSVAFLIGLGNKITDGIVGVGGFGTEGIGYGNQSIQFIILVICFVAVLVGEGRDLTGCGR